MAGSFLIFQVPAKILIPKRCLPWSPELNTASLMVHLVPLAMTPFWFIWALVLSLWTQGQRLPHLLSPWHIAALPSTWHTVGMELTCMADSRNEWLNASCVSAMKCQFTFKLLCNKFTIFTQGKDKLVWTWEERKEVSRSLRLLIKDSRIHCSKEGATGRYDRAVNLCPSHEMTPTICFPESLSHLSLLSNSLSWNN